MNPEPAGLDVGAMFDRPPADVSQIFASDRDETRVRRPADAVVVVVSAIVVALAGWASGGDSELETWIADIFDDAPAWMRSIAVVGFSLCGIAVLALVATVAFRSRWALVRDVFTAIIVTLLTVVILGQWVSSEWPDLVPEIWADATPRSRSCGSRWWSRFCSPSVRRSRRRCVASTAGSSGRASSVR